MRGKGGRKEEKSYEWKVGVTLTRVIIIISGKDDDVAYEDLKFVPFRARRSRALTHVKSNQRITFHFSISALLLSFSVSLFCHLSINDHVNVNLSKFTSIL